MNTGVIRADAPGPKPTIECDPGDIVRDVRNRLMLVHSWFIAQTWPDGKDGPPKDCALVRGWVVVAQSAPLRRGEHHLEDVPGLPTRSAWLVRSIEVIEGRPVELVAHCGPDTVGAISNAAWRARESERAERQ